jgi:5-methylthioadenosine/S-adenosylhomocysteine deaminase
MATIEAAQVLRLDDIVGSLEVGKAADVIILDGDAPHLMAMQHLPSEIVRYATRAEVEATIVNGRVLYANGAFASIDIERLRDDAMAGAAHVREVLAGRRYRELPRF